MNNEKNNGIFYTPQELAGFVAKLAIKHPNSTILDPCYGEGVLLFAAHKRLIELGSSTPKKQLFGYDIAPPKEGVRKRKFQRLLERRNLKKRDFFSQIEQEIEPKFDVILMNPPFVRHHLIPKETQTHIRSIVGDDMNLPKTSSLWAYFLVHGFKFIRHEGSLVAILPWSFLHADFARRVKELLLERFRILRVVIIGRRMFERAEERVVVLLGQEYGFLSQNIEIYYSFDIPKRHISWTPVGRNSWISSQWGYLLNGDIKNIISKVRNTLGLETLGRFADIHIGTVTGANKFFILERKIARSLGLSKRILKPIIRHSRDLNKFVISDSDDVEDMILLIPEDMKLPKTLKDYIKKGEKMGINNRYYAQKRIKWYSISEQKPPDGFLHYMTKEVPFIVLNPDGLLSTNTVHQVDFLEKVDKNTKKWIQFSMFTSISQLSVELVGRTYGGGVLKIEPSDAKEILVYPGNKRKFPNNLENKLNDLLLKGKRREAMKFADNWITANLGIPIGAVDSIVKCYQNIRDLRLGKNAQYELRKQLEKDRDDLNKLVD